MAGRIRIFWLALAAACLAATARADGLSRFEQELKPKVAPQISLTYGSASAIGAGGFELRDVKAILKDPDKPAEKPTPVAAKRVVVEDIDFDGIKAANEPNFARMRFEGVTVSGEAQEWARKFGVPDGAGDLAVDYRFDPARKVFTLNKLELVLPGLARFDLTMIMDGVTASSASTPEKALDDGSLRTATFVYEDSSLLSKLIPGIAAEEKKTPEAYIAENVALLGFFAKDQAPKTIAVLDALASFTQDYKQTKGPLRVTVTPPTGITAKDFDKMTVANAVVDALGLSVTYAGTRPGAALAAAPKDNAAAPAPQASSAPQTAAVPPGGGAVACTPGQRLFALSDGGWWSATVREGTQSGNRCVVRFDDGDEDGVVTQEEMVAWSMDGPGAPARRCQKGDKVLMPSEGAWYPAQVKLSKGSSCVVEMDDDDEEHTLALNKLRVLTR